MKILLVCAGGMSTSMLMKKMEKWAAEKGEELSVKAVGTSEYEDEAAKFDVILVGPQVSYKLQEIKKNTGKPVGAIVPYDYAVGNVESIIKQAKALQK